MTRKTTIRLIVAGATLLLAFSLPCSGQGVQLWLEAKGKLELRITGRKYERPKDETHSITVRHVSDPRYGKMWIMILDDKELLTILDSGSRNWRIIGDPTHLSLLRDIGLFYLSWHKHDLPGDLQYRFLSPDGTQHADVKFSPEEAPSRELKPAVPIEVEWYDSDTGLSTRTVIYRAWDETAGGELEFPTRLRILTEKNTRYARIKFDKLDGDSAGRRPPPFTFDFRVDEPVPGTEETPRRDPAHITPRKSPDPVSQQPSPSAQVAVSGQTALWWAIPGVLLTVAACVLLWFRRSRETQP